MTELATREGDGWYAAPGVVAWRFGAVDGGTFWGHMTAAHLRLGFDVVRHYADAGARPIEVITDLGGVTSVDEDLYAQLSTQLTELVPRIAPRVRRQVIILPDGVLGCAIAGLMHLRASHTWQVAPTLRAAAGDVLATRVAAIVEPLRDADLVGALRLHLARELDASLQDAARALGASPRTLQRALLGAGTSFREVVDDARISAARRLLGESDLKVEAIAREVGFRSLSGFVRSFRRHVGHSPHEHRVRRSA